MILVADHSGAHCSCELDVLPFGGHSLDSIEGAFRCRKTKILSALSFNVSLKILSWPGSPIGPCSPIAETCVDSASIWAMIQKQATKDHLRWYFGCWFQPGGRQIYAGERQPPESRTSDPKAPRAIQTCARSPQSSESYWPQRLTKATKMIYAFMHCVSDHPTQMKPEVSRGRMSKSTTFPDQ